APRNPKTDAPRLAGGAAAGNRDLDVELVGRLGQLARLAHDHARGLAAEELLDRTLVDGDLAIALAQVDACGGGLAAAGAVILGDCHGRDLRCPAAAAAGRSADDWGR